MKRPLFIFLLFLLEGILVGKYFKLNTIFFIILILNILLVKHIFKIYKLKIVFSFIISFLLGVLLLKNVYINKNNMLNCYINASESFTIDCNVKKITYTKDNKQKIIVKVKKLYLKRKIFKNKFNILAILKDNENVNLGQEIKIKGKILPLSNKKNPQDTDEFIYLKARNIDYKMFPEIIEKGKINNNIYTLLNKLKIKLINVYDKVLPNKESYIVKSMILAEKTNEDTNIKDLYKMSGIYHLLVISGLHITILTIFLNFIFEKVFNFKLSCILTMLFIILYCILVGCGISTIRAVIMATITLLSKLIYKEPDFITSISFAAISILLYNPLYLWDIGFQLSFIIVFSIAFCTNSMNNLYGILFKKFSILNFLLKKYKFRNILSSTTVVTLYLSPILSYYFFYINLYSLIINLIILPTSSIVVVFSFLLGIIGIINVNISKFLSCFLVILLKLYEIICKIFINLPYSQILIGRKNILFIIFFYLIISFLFYISLYYSRFVKNKKYFIIITTTYIFLILLFKTFNNIMDITFLNVKEGESTVITLKNETYIIDGGGVKNKEIGENVGKKILKTFLDYKGINNIDIVFITNLDKDHITGIIELLSLKNIKKVILPCNIDLQNNMYLILKKELEKHKVLLEFVDNKFKLNSKKGINIEVLYPFYKNKNNKGNMVLNLTYKDTKFLFTSSIKKEEEDFIINNYKNIKAHVLKVPFGKNIKKDENNFLNLVSPNIAIINEKYNNYNTDTEENNYKNIDIYSTKKDNAIIIKTNGKKIYLFKMKQGD